jgi:hypothetical protein
MRELSFEQALDGPFAEAMADFDDSAWRTFLRALDGKPPLPDQQALFEQCTGRSAPFTSLPRQAQACCGRRSGKTRIAALIAATAAAFWDHSVYLSKGERGRVMLLATSKDQSTIAKNYVLALLESHDVTRHLIDGVTAEEIVLTNGIDIVIRAASFRGLRGHTCPLILADETAFWRDHETSTNPASEIFRALAPGQSTVPQPLLLSISSPFAKEGVFYETHVRHWGDNESGTLCWQAASRVMNPTLEIAVIEQAFLDDPQAAAAEYGGEFRSDVATFLDRDVIMACIETGRTQRGAITGVRYYAFSDPSGGSKDAFTCAVAHREGDDGVILDRLVEIKAPFDPGAAVGEVVATLKEFGLATITGDKYAAQWVTGEFKKHGVTYVHAMQDRSAIYIAALPLFNAGRAQLLDNKRLVNQLCGLQRRTSSSGRQSVDHPRHGADDLANSACGALVLASEAQQPMRFVPPLVFTRPRISPYEPWGVTPFGDYGF